MAEERLLSMKRASNGFNKINGIGVQLWINNGM